MASGTAFVAATDSGQRDSLSHVAWTAGQCLISYPWLWYLGGSMFILNFSFACRLMQHPVVSA